MQLASPAFHIMSFCQNSAATLASPFNPQRYGFLKS